MALTSAYKYEVFSGTAGALDLTVSFTFPSRWVDVYVYNNPATIKFLGANGLYLPEITFDPTYTSFPIPVFLQTRGFMIRNTSPALNADYQIIPHI